MWIVGMSLNFDGLDTVYIEVKDIVFYSLFNASVRRPKLVETRLFHSAEDVLVGTH